MHPAVCCGETSGYTKMEAAKAVGGVTFCRGNEWTASHRWTLTNKGEESGGLFLVCWSNDWTERVSSFHPSTCSYRGMGGMNQLLEYIIDLIYSLDTPL